MNRSQALQRLTAAGLRATLQLAEDPECEDDQFVLNGNDNICVQISATRDGLEFTASVADGEGDDWGVTHGRGTADPVAAAREALLLALA